MQRISMIASGLVALAIGTFLSFLWISERNDLRATAVMLTIAIAPVGVGMTCARRGDRRRVSVLVGAWHRSLSTPYPYPEDRGVP
ncbi:MAG: hypothetical protein HOV76_09850 [Hamadaea sp.]|nr:hypothetical protein [Nonomuraea sp.]NUT03772.1 hypothetical protein [Hamadaea sp.]